MSSKHPAQTDGYSRIPPCFLNVCQTAFGRVKSILHKPDLPTFPGSCRINVVIWKKGGQVSLDFTKSHSSEALRHSKAPGAASRRGIRPAMWRDRHARIGPTRTLLSSVKEGLKGTGGFRLEGGISDRNLS